MSKFWICVLLLNLTINIATYGHAYTHWTWMCNKYKSAASFELEPAPCDPFTKSLGAGVSGFFWPWYWSVQLQKV